LNTTPNHQTKTDDTDLLGWHRPELRFALCALLAFILALILRLIWIFHWPVSIESEGVYYARIAENLLSGRGFVGAREAGTQLLYPPLYPGLIAAVTTIFHNSELAGRLVSAVCGSFWVVPVMFITRSAFDEVAGVIAGIIASVGPPLVAISGTVQSEPVYLLFQAVGIFYVLQLWPNFSNRASYLAGICFGIAYLARPEAAIYILLTTLFIFLTACRGLRWKNAARLVLAFSLTILPYVTWLSIQTGSLRLEAKSVSNYIEATGWAAHLPPGQIFFAVDKQLNDVGLSNQSDLAMIQKTKMSTGKALWLAAHGASVNVSRLFSMILESRLFGGSIFVLLLGIGVISAAQNKTVLIRRGFLLAGCFASVLPLFSLHDFHDRFVFPFLTMLLPFAAGGVTHTYRSIKSLIAAASGDGYPRKFVSTASAAAIAGLLMLAYLGMEAHAMLHLDKDVRLPEQDITVQRGDAFPKTIGLEIRNFQVKNALVMDGTPAIGYYAGASDWPLPYCDGETALRYIQKKNPDFIVLETSRIEVFPYLENWLEKGIPDARTQLVYQATAPDGRVAKIYRRR